MGILDLFKKRRKETVCAPHLEMTIYRVPQKERVCPSPEKEMACPYCQKALEKKLTRKTKCPHCGKLIYVRHGELVTEEQKVKHDDLDLFRSTEDEYGTTQLKLQQKFGAMPSHSDIIWGIANGKIPVLLRQRAYSELSDLYLAMAKFMHKQGKDFFELFKESRKCELMVFRQIDDAKVRVLTCGAESPSCKIYSEKEFPVNEALEIMPIPQKGCLNQNRKGFHICMYMMVSEFDRDYSESQ
jgi:hypothetical protein